MNGQFAGAGIAILGPFPPRAGGVSVQCATLAQHLEAEGANVTRINTDVPALRRLGRSGKLLMPLVQVMLVLWTILRTRQRWQILHAHAASCWGFMPAAAGLAAAALGKRLVITYHGGQAAQFMARWGWLARPMLRRAHALLALTATQANLFASHGLNPAIVPNIVPIADFPFRLRGELAPRLLWLRQFEARYRPHDAVAVYTRLLSLYPAATLTLAGGGTLAAELERAVEQQKLGGVTLRSQLRPHEIAEVYDDADIFLNTSAVDNLPLTLIEASACGLPVVSTAAGAIPDLIQDGVNGLLAPVGDADALAAHCLELLADPDLARSLAQAGRANAERFAWAQVAPLLAEAYAL